MLRESQAMLHESHAMSRDMGQILLEVRQSSARTEERGGSHFSRDPSALTSERDRLSERAAAGKRSNAMAANQTMSTRRWTRYCTS